MIKKFFTVLLGLLVAGTMISVDCSDAAVKRNRVRPRTVSKPVTQPAPTATQRWRAGRCGLCSCCGCACLACGESAGL